MTKGFFLGVKRAFHAAGTSWDFAHPATSRAEEYAANQLEDVAQGNPS